MKEVLKEIWSLAKADMIFTPVKIVNLLWRFHAWYNRRLLDGNAKITQRYLNYEYYRKAFVTKYMSDQGYSVPAVTRVVLKNDYQAVVAIHFFNPEHLVINRDKSEVRPVYSRDLLVTDYFLDEETGYE